MRSKTHVPEVVRAWRTGPGEDAWYALTAAERRGLLESLAPLGDDDDLDDVDLPGGARSFAAKPGVRELIEWILELAHGSALADPPHLGEYVRHAIPDFQKAMSLAQSCAARGRLGERISNPWALVATYSAHPDWHEWAAPAKRRTPAETRLLDAVTAKGGLVATRELASLVTGVTGAELDAARGNLVERLVLFQD